MATVGDIRAMVPGGLTPAAELPGEHTPNDVRNDVAEAERWLSRNPKVRELIDVYRESPHRLADWDKVVLPATTLVKDNAWGGPMVHMLPRRRCPEKFERVAATIDDHFKRQSPIRFADLYRHAFVVSTTPLGANQNGDRQFETGWGRYEGRIDIEASPCKTGHLVAVDRDELEQSEAFVGVGTEFMVVAFARTANDGFVATFRPIPPPAGEPKPLGPFKQWASALWRGTNRP